MHHRRRIRLDLNKPQSDGYKKAGEGDLSGFFIVPGLYKSARSLVRAYYALVVPVLATVPVLGIAAASVDPALVIDAVDA
jgi:hypothetical protein